MAEDKRDFEEVYASAYKLADDDKELRSELRKLRRRHFDVENELVSARSKILAQEHEIRNYKVRCKHKDQNVCTMGEAVKQARSKMHLLGPYARFKAGLQVDPCVEWEPETWAGVADEVRALLLRPGFVPLDREPRQVPHPEATAIVED